MTVKDKYLKAICQIYTMRGVLYITANPNKKAVYY